MSETQRYPLSWPQNWPRTSRHQRRRAKFSTGGKPLSVYEAIRRLSNELDRLHASNMILSTNVQTRLDGLPRSNQGEPLDPGAAVYFKLRGAPRCLACDRWNRVADNICALAQHIDALRRIDRYGVGSLEQAFAGYAGLPPKADPWEVLGVSRDATEDDIIAAYRKLAVFAHPDKQGGSHDLMARLNSARDEALRILKEMR